MAKRGKLSASLEDYIEAIFHLASKDGVARAKDISDRLKVAGSSVTGAMHSLEKRGLINYAPYGHITLTPKGIAIAKDVVRRHEGLRKFLVEILAIDRDEANEIACAMEHVVTHRTLERFLDFMEFVEMCPRGGSERIKQFRKYYEHGTARSALEKRPKPK